MCFFSFSFSFAISRNFQSFDLSIFSCADCLSLAARWSFYNFFIFDLFVELNFFSYFQSCFASFDLFASCTLCVCVSFTLVYVFLFLSLCVCWCGCSVFDSCWCVCFSLSVCVSFWVFLAFLMAYIFAGSHVYLSFAF